MSLPLLPFHRSILSEIHDPATSDLLIIARGLGLRRTICTLLKIYDGPKNLVLVVNATPEEEVGIGEELGVMGCRRPGLRVVGYEMGRKDRQSLYKQGGLIAVTSRILVVDMLQSDVPVDLITGIVIMHAESVTPSSLPAFIVRLFREKNKDGFVKAFTDAPEHITSGMYPLRTLVKELMIRRIHIYPRFHEEVKQSLSRRKADVVELYQPLTDSMKEIHTAIVQCMSATLAELKRTNTTLDLDDINIENAYFRSFDAIVRRQLDPVWHKVGPRTKQLVGDLATLRNLLGYLLTYDSLAFHAYLESIIAANSVSAQTGNARRNQSMWLFMDAAETIFGVAKRRCYVVESTTLKAKPKEVVEISDDEDAWEALNEAEAAAGGASESWMNVSAGRSRETAIKVEEGVTIDPNASAKGVPKSRSGHIRENESDYWRRKKWLPAGILPTLEELPKWTLLAEVLEEIEDDIRAGEARGNTKSYPGTPTTLVLCSSQRTCDVLAEFLANCDRTKAKGEQGGKMMERRLRRYLGWKGGMGTGTGTGVTGASGGSGGMAKFGSANGQATMNTNTPSNTTNSGSKMGTSTALSEALRRKDEEKRRRNMNRRRIRGGAPGAGASATIREGTPSVSVSATGATSASPLGRTPGGDVSAQVETGMTMELVGGMSGKEREKLGLLVGEGEMRREVERVREFYATQGGGMAPTVDLDGGADEEDDELQMISSARAALSRAGTSAGVRINRDEEIAAALQADEFTFLINPTTNDEDYGLVQPSQTVILRAYGDDSDDRVLAEVMPRYIVMYEPSREFVRRVECYRSANPGLAVRVYLMVYHLSCEEHKYLAGLRKEKDAFERLIKERGSMLMPIHEERRPGRGEAIIRTISTRIAGGKEISSEPSQVIVDIREFRSTLPSLLHAAKLLVIPATLTVGDYILSPDICVERKSIPDLVSSFNSGRLYTQCELMSTHYKQPVLLIEFEEHKSFSLELAEDAKSTAKKYMTKKKGPLPTSSSDPSSLSTVSIQAKLVLLTLSFPRLRILWSSSPHQSSILFTELKMHRSEPDPVRAIAVGAEEAGSNGESGAGETASTDVNTAAEEMLRALPGVTAGNVGYIMRRVGNVRAFCGMSLEDVQGIMGLEPGKVCWEFMHRGD